MGGANNDGRSAETGKTGTLLTAEVLLAGSWDQRLVLDGQPLSHGSRKMAGTRTDMLGSAIPPFPIDAVHFVVVAWAY